MLPYHAPELLHKLMIFNNLNKKMNNNLYNQSIDFVIINF